LKTELLHKYLSGECTTKEEKQVETWLHSSPENQKRMNEMKQIWDIPPGKRIHVDSYKAWDSLRERVLHSHNSASETEQLQHSKRKHKQFYKNMDRRRRRGARLIAYSAAVAAVLMIAFLFSHISLMSVAHEPELSMQEITTNKGQRTSVKLSDGTRVHLNAESKLIVPENYTNNNRIVTLEGEAFFEVETNTDRMFFVHANHSVTQVLGTKFNVRAYPDEESVEVVVAEGKVSLNSDENMLAPEVQLTRNQRGTFSRNGEIVASTITDTERYLDWTKGKLTFRDTPVGEVKSRLERWYDIEVILEGDFSVGEQLLTGTFEDVPLSVVLSSIALSLDLHYKQDGNTVIFLKK